ncbi:MAG: hypothetical protein RIQ89_1475 [Bacteroidota bacterium]|jgi:hypothetical protein
MSKRRIQQKTRQRQTQKLKYYLIAASASIVVGLTIVMVFVFQLGDTKKSKAAGNANGGSNISNGEVIASFNFNSDSIHKAIIGPDAIQIGKAAYLSLDGRALTGALNGGGKELNYTIPGDAIFDQEGIDMSIDYRYSEPSGSFFSRGSNFNFGIHKGFLAISFKVENKSGGFILIDAQTDYEVPQDNQWRNYRFIFNPTNGVAEIFVSSVPVWSHKVGANTALYWKDAGNIIIGKNMDAEGNDVGLFDNLIIRTTSYISPLAETLINFSLQHTDKGIKVHWMTTAGDRVKSFSIDRSINGIDFTNVAIINAFPPEVAVEGYAHLDQSPVNTGITYYRIKQHFKDGKFVSHPVAAIKIKNDPVTAVIEQITPANFQSAIDIAYQIPQKGKVWIQLTDQKGKIYQSQTFEAAQGKNLYSMKNLETLTSGVYRLHLIYNEKKVSKDIQKI